jgi:Xaa-Pro aminopeptidase
MIEKEELTGRIRLVREAMTRDGLDALVIFDSERPQGGGNIRYLTGYYTLLPNLASALVITAEVSHLCVAQGMYGSSLRVADLVCPWVDVSSSGNHFFMPDLPADIAAVIESAGLTNCRVAIDGLHLMQDPLASGIRAALSSHTLTENSGIVERLRLVKSAAEVEIIREAARLADIGVTAFFGAARVGELQDAAVAAGEQASKAAGAEDVSIYMGTGVPWIWGKYRNRACFRDGDMVAVEFNTRFQGYYGQVARSGVVGTATDRHRLVFETSVGAYHAMRELLQPGVTAAEVFEAGDRVVTAAGFQSQRLRAGHGMGLTYGEGFDIYRDNHTEIKAGYVVMLHAMTPAEDEGLVGFSGDNLLITADGWESLNQAPYRLQA